MFSSCSCSQNPLHEGSFKNDGYNIFRFFTIPPFSSLYYYLRFKSYVLSSQNPLLPPLRVWRHRWPLLRFYRLYHIIKNKFISESIHNQQINTVLVIKILIDYHCSIRENVSILWNLERRQYKEGTPVENSNTNVSWLLIRS